MVISSASPLINAYRKRMVEVLAAAKFIPPEDLRKERELETQKWFDYRFMGPLAATKEFSRQYVKTYKETWARNIDVSEAKRRRGLAGGSLFSPSSKGVSLWRARQFADALGVPYDFFCQEAFRFWCDHARELRLPQPNQLYSERWRDGIRRAVHGRWEEVLTDATPYPALPQYQVGAARGTNAQIMQIEFAVEVLNELKLGAPVAIGRAVYNNGILPEERAIEAFGEERLASAREAVSPGTPVDVSKLTDSDFLPSCMFVPHAYDERADECASCHVRVKCGAAQGMLLKKVEEHHGSADPVKARENEAGRLRTRKCRALKQAAEASTTLSLHS